MQFVNYLDSSQLYCRSSRGLDFVFDKNRLNVAISRAQALAIVVANQGLEQCAVNSLEQMEKVGFFCKLQSNAASLSQ